MPHIPGFIFFLTCRPAENIPLCQPSPSDAPNNVSVQVHHSPPQNLIQNCYKKNTEIYTDSNFKTVKKSGFINFTWMTLKWKNTKIGLMEAVTSVNLKNNLFLPIKLKLWYKWHWYEAITILKTTQLHHTNILVLFQSETCEDKIT